MGNLSEKCYGENQNTFYIQFFPPENSAVYEINCKNMVQSDRPQIT